jgi:hypothetical protein
MEIKSNPKEHTTNRIRFSEAKLLSVNKVQNKNGTI